MIRKVGIREDVKHYQDTLSYALSKVNYSLGLSVYVLPSDMNLNIRSGPARSSYPTAGKVTVNASAPEKQAIKHPSFQSMATKKSCPRQNTPQPSHTKRKDHFVTHSNQCLRNMGCFSIMRSTRRGDLS